MNFQRNIFAGLLIFLIFLMIPYYLNFIGLYEDDFIEDSQNDSVLGVAVPPDLNTEKDLERDFISKDAPQVTN